MFYPLANTTWDDAEYAALQEVIASDRFTMGARVREFEEAFAKKFGKKYAVMTSSGSTANLLGITAAFHHPDFGFEPGDEVIVPAVSWSTTYFPITQNGMKLRFVDIDPETMNIDVDQVAAAITPRTKMVFAVNLLGNPIEADRLRKICADAGILLAEDNCESMGASLNGEKAGAFGLFGTFSTFFSHHICTMEGGLVITDDRKLYDNMLSIRAHGWSVTCPRTRTCRWTPTRSCASSASCCPATTCAQSKWKARWGIPQLAKLDSFVAERRKNAVQFQSLFGDHEHLTIQRETGESSWFGFAMVLQGKMRGQRAALVDALKEAEIECRPIVTGNFLRNPVIDKLDHNVFGQIKAADVIDSEGLFVGNHHHPIPAQLDRLREVVDATCAKF